MAFAGGNKRNDATVIKTNYLLATSYRLIYCYLLSTTGKMLFNADVLCSNAVCVNAAYPTTAVGPLLASRVCSRRRPTCRPSATLLSFMASHGRSAATFYTDRKRN